MTQDSVVYLVAGDGGHEDVAHELRRAGWRVERFGGVEAFLASRDAEQPGCLLIDKTTCSNGFDNGFDPGEALLARGDELPFIVLRGVDDASPTVELPGHGTMAAWPSDAGSATAGAATSLLDRVAKAMRIDRVRREQRKRLAQSEAELAALSEPARELIAWMCEQAARMA